MWLQPGGGGLGGVILDKQDLEDTGEAVEEETLYRQQEDVFPMVLVMVLYQLVRRD